MTRRPDDQSDEAHRILDRIEREHAPMASNLARRAAGRLQDHVAASDADQGDSIELWGTRIGRVLGLVVMAGLVVYLILVLSGG